MECYLMIDPERIIKRLKMILHTFDDIEEKSHRAHIRLINVIEELIEHADGVDIDTDRDILKYLDYTSSFFIKRAQDYSDYCQQNIEDMEMIASSLEEDAMYIESACNFDYENYDLRYDFNIVIERMRKHIDMDQAVFYFKNIPMTFNAFADNFYEFIESYEYAKKIDLINDEMWNEYVGYCKALIYVKLDLEKILRRDNEKDPVKKITEADFKKMMGDDK